MRPPNIPPPNPLPEFIMLSRRPFAHEHRTEKRPFLNKKAFAAVPCHVDMAFWAICRAFAREGLIVLTGYEEW